MTEGYEIAHIGAPDASRDHFGGFDESRSRERRRVVDHGLTMQYIESSRSAVAAVFARTAASAPRLERS